MLFYPWPTPEFESMSCSKCFATGCFKLHHSIEHKKFSKPCSKNWNQRIIQVFTLPTSITPLCLCSPMMYFQPNLIWSIIWVRQQFYCIESKNSHSSSSIHILCNLSRVYNYSWLNRLTFYSVTFFCKNPIVPIIHKYKISWDLGL